MLGGHGKAFCAGADLSWMRAMAGYTWDAEPRRRGTALAEMLWTSDRCPLPVVGRIQGDCYAGGVGLAAVCDVLVAAEGVQLLPAARRGSGCCRRPSGRMSCEALGEQASRRYFVTAERFDAARARALGFVHEFVAPEALDAKVDADRRGAGRQRPGGGEGLQAAGAGRRRAAASTPRCATTRRAASPTSAPAPRAARACRPSWTSASRHGAMN